MNSGSDSGISRREFLQQVAAASAMAAAAGSGVGWGSGGASPPAGAPLPAGVRPEWDLTKAYQEITPTRARVSVNGLWQWQPAAPSANQVPAGNWGYFKVPGCWPGTSDYMQVESQTVHSDPSWRNVDLGEVNAAWYQREITIPAEWTGRRISLSMEYLNSYATVYLDGKQVGELRFPGGEVDLTSVCEPGGKYLLTLFILAMPLKGVMLSYSDTASAKEVKGSVERRGLCGDVYLIGAPSDARITDVKVSPSVREWQLTVEAGLTGLAAGAAYLLRAQVTDGDRVVREFSSHRFSAADLDNGRIAFTDQWRPDKLWDIHTPGNTYQLSLSLLAADGKDLDTAHPVRFGFREFWIDGRDFYLNGDRIYLSVEPIDNAAVSAGAATYEAARETMERLQSFGINFVYGHNYGCEPGSHLSFTELLRAADDVGMLVAFSQPHFGHYDWDAPDADQSNGYARHAEFYVRAAQNHPSVVAYAMSHNGTGYNEDMNPEMMDGIQAPRSKWSLENTALATRAETIVKLLDPGRIIYHHSSGNLGSMHTVNFYPNFVPIQEMSDWFEHWATVGVKPIFLCEYAAPMTWDWALYRGWYKGTRTFGSAQVPWEFCIAEWDSQFMGDRAFRMTEAEKTNLRWEAARFREGKLWFRWDYPHQLGSSDFDDRHQVIAAYTADNWRAHRTWGVSANSPWDYTPYWRPREGVDRKRRDLPVDWERLQRPGFSPDYIDRQFEVMPMAFERSDWLPQADATALIRNNLSLLAYIGGKPTRFTSKDHNSVPGEAIEKQLILINNSRRALTCNWEWSLGLPQPITGQGTTSLPTGDQARLPIHLALPTELAPGVYQLTATARFSTGETQTDSFAMHVMPAAPLPKVQASIALFDPVGETADLLRRLRVDCHPVDAGADLSRYDLLVIGKQALTLDGPGPDLGRVRDGLKVILFEQTSQMLEKRLGFRIQEYGLRQVFPRLADHPLLAGLQVDHLRDWRGQATLLPPHLKYEIDDDRFNGAPVVKWCDIDVTRLWRCGCWGNVASVLIEKPVRGDFLPLLDGGFSLQYSPLMEYRDGKGMILFCQMDVTGRTETDPAAETLARNIVQYASSWRPAPEKAALYIGDPAGRTYLEAAGVALRDYAGGELPADHALIVGPGGGLALQASAAPIASWLAAGGHLLAIGLDEANANAFLPFRVSMKKEEHICASFGPFPAGSLLAGVGPADVVNRDPRELSLLSGGASIIGNGVLAVSEHANVVFCQLMPWEFDYQKQHNLKWTHRRSGFLVDRLLGNMGVSGATPLLSRFRDPVSPDRPEKRWLDGLYLDQPEEWDDPYRFFRW